jgi:hypothetical protein
LGLAELLAVATFEAALPARFVKASTIVGLFMFIGGEIYFCHCLGRLAAGLGHRARKWSVGVWIASKLLVFIAWWLALLKMRSLVNRTFAGPTVIDGL